MKKGLLLLLFSQLALARDPFVAEHNRCQQAAAFPVEWRLLGVLGHGQALSSRWQSPEGRSVSLGRQARLGQSAWQIENIALTQVTLVNLTDCSQTAHYYSLKKGTSDAKNGHSQRDAAAVVGKRR